MNESAYGTSAPDGVHAWTTYRGDELSESRIRAEMDRIARG